MENENVFLTVNKMLWLITGKLIAGVKKKKKKKNISISFTISENCGFWFMSSINFGEAASWVKMGPQGERSF